MAEALIPVKHLEDITECAICHDTFTDPRTPPCIHTFCLKCITECYKDKLPQDSVNCPFCRKEVQIPDKGVIDFPKNTFIDSQTQCQGRVFSPTLTHSVRPGIVVSAIAAFDNMLFIARGYDSNEVGVHDASMLQQLRQIAIPRCHSCGLATCSTNNCLYVSDYYNNKIHKVSLSTYTVTTSWSTATWPRGLSVNRSHNLLVVCETKTIAEYSTTGSRVRKISTDDNCLFQAIELNDGTLAVTRYGPVHGVCVMSVDGEVVRFYGSSPAGSGPGQMNYPCGLAVDKQGFIVVADRGNNRIIVLNPTLTDSRVLPLPVSPGFSGPCGLWYNESRGRLYIGEWSDNGRFLVFDNVFNLSTLFS